MSKVLVLGGGPDAERPVSLTSSKAVAQALGTQFDVHLEIIETLTPDSLNRLSGDVIFPALHGAWGEGGPLQDILEQDGRPYVGSGPGPARACMDKMGTKLIAARANIPTPRAHVLDPRDRRVPLDLPVVLKPTHDGSSVGLFVCHTLTQLEQALASIASQVSSHPGRAMMIEQFITGRELTVGLVGQGDHLEALPIVEICPEAGVYDYEAKYERNDTRYLVNPPLEQGAADRIAALALKAASLFGVRDLARVDFVLDDQNEPWLLEINTMPGFTPTSLLPKAARAQGMSFDDLCIHLVRLALTRGPE